MALLSAYSYAKLNVRYQSAGGTVTFPDRAFVVDFLTGSLNVLLWLSYVVIIALVASAFGSYGATFFQAKLTGRIEPAPVTSAIALPVLINLKSPRAVGRSEMLTVTIEIALLLFFVGVGVQGVQPSRIAPSAWASSIRVAAGGMIIFLAYEGFALIANTAHDIIAPKRNLPRAFLGQAGFTRVALAALLSTSSAIHTTLHGAARLAFTIAKERELPEVLDREVHGQPMVGLLLRAGLAIVLANTATWTASRRWAAPASS